MLRILVFLVIVFLLALGFSWIADNPGLVTVTLPGQGDGSPGKEIEVSLMVAVVATVSLIASIMIVWSIIMTIWRSPVIFSRWRKGRRKDRGYEALSRGMIAAAAGDAPTARKLAGESNKLLSSEPLVSLLDAQTALLEDKRDVAQSKFEKMLEQPDTRLLGLRGLYVEAERQGEAEAAAHYAERAMELAPEASWAGTALLRHQSNSGNWQGALKTLESNRWTNKKSKKENNRLKAVLQTAEAMALENSEPDQARALAFSAHKLAPELVPASVIAARISSRLGDYRKASKVLETTWKIEPHPEIAEAYIHVRSGDSAADRLKRARLLASKRQNHMEGQFAIAEAAIDAKDWATAREALAVILRSNPTERACLLMADIEEAEHGDRGRMRDWLSRAVRAPRDPAWTADGYISENWAPVSPISGRLDAFEWKVPVEMIGGVEDAVDYSEFATEPLPATEVQVAPFAAAAAATPALIDNISDIETVEEKIIEAGPVAVESSMNTQVDGVETTIEPVAGPLSDEPDPLPTDTGNKESATTDAPEPVNGTYEPSSVSKGSSSSAKNNDVEIEGTEKPELETTEKKTQDLEEATPELSKGEKPDIIDAPVTNSDDQKAKSQEKEKTSSAEPEMPVLPDDPGVKDTDLEEPASGRFRLF